LALRVFEIAKALNVPSKTVVAKCHAEGIPESVIKNHMSSVSVGLEATIRDWFSVEAAHDEGGGTATETAARVDIEKIRVKPKRTKAVAHKATAVAKSIGDNGDSGDSQDSATTATATTLAPEAPATDSKVDAESPADDAIAPGAANATTSPPATDAPPAEVLAPGPASLDQGNGQVDQAPAAPMPTEAAAAAPATTAPVTDAPASPPKPTATRPAPMNVPVRPKIIKPAGPQLDHGKKEQVKLAGPKVVRIEAPEVIDPPRRRPPSDYGGSGGGGRGAGFGPGGGGGDGGRSPRRGGKRREPAQGGGSQGGSWSGNNYSAADLAERQSRLQHSGGYLKQRRQLARRSTQSERPQNLAETGGKVAINAPFTIKDLSAATGVKAAEIVKRLFLEGVMATANSGIEVEKAQEILFDYNIELDVQEAKSAEEVVTEEFGQRDMVDERRRGPVVTILGHVDHGKTSLLDRIRNANVADGEAGGITQATSAFRVPVNVGDAEKIVVFIDTPGHAAFTEMRSRGANITDLCVIVVAADDGVMPQTIESIAHAKAAGTPVIVALNKIDKAQATDANIQRILGQLAEHGLNPVEWGGDTEIVKTSATKDIGIQELLDVLDYQAELLELKADFGGPARGSVIEARTQIGRGVVANILVSDGELKVGDFIVAGRGFGRVRDITDDRAKKSKTAVPPSPIQISGLDQIPDAGDPFYVVDSLKKAQEAAEQRRDRDREAQLAKPKVTLDTLLSQMQSTERKEILIVLKADVQGSIDVLRNEIEKVSGDEVKVRVLHAAVGGITESDVILAEASKAIIIGFNVIPSSKARSIAEVKRVEIRKYDVIYHITEDIIKAAEGLLEPELRQEVLGHAEVRQVFRVSKVGMIAGCYVTDGVIERDALIRVTRSDVVIENDRKLSQLKRVKDDAKSVRNGLECGMKIDGYDDIKAGDILECYKQIEIKRTLGGS